MSEEASAAALTNLAALERLLAAATEAPWSVTHDVDAPDFESRRWVVVPLGADEAVALDLTDNDAALIVAAVNALPSLIEAARREAGLRSALEAMVETVRGTVRPGDPAYDDLWYPMAHADALLTATPLQKGGLLHDSAGATARAALPAEGTE